MATSTSTRKFCLTDPRHLLNLCGEYGVNLKYLSRQTGVKITNSGLDVTIYGSSKVVKKCTEVIKRLLQRAKTTYLLPTDYEEVLLQLSREIQEEVIIETRTGHLVKAKTKNQKHYVEVINSHQITFGIGMAGTGKTFLATMLGIRGLLRGDYNKLVLTRPAIEAGENLGFLKGDLLEKVDPYLRPLYDSLFEVIEPVEFEKLMAEGKIEVAPIAFMRGRSFHNSFIIVDEAQNTTTAQLKMIMTRFGFNSKMVITGDITQTDLPDREVSGLKTAEKILRGIEGIGFCHLGADDVVRNPLVHKIATAYDDFFSPKKIK